MVGDRQIDLFGGTELIALDTLAKTEKKRRDTKKTQRLSSQVPHELREIDVSMVKVVSTARRAVAVRCIGCGSQSVWPIAKRLLLSGTNGHDV